MYLKNWQSWNSNQIETWKVIIRQGIKSKPSSIIIKTGIWKKLRLMKIERKKIE